jgi:hypothetical protein
MAQLPLDPYVFNYNQDSVTISTRDFEILKQTLAWKHSYERLYKTLQIIQQWDCLNPPLTDLCSDFPWLKALVNEALS